MPAIEIRDNAKEAFTQLIHKGISKGVINKLSESGITKLATNLENGIFNYAIRVCKETGQRRAWEEQCFKDAYKTQFAFIHSSLDLPKGNKLLIEVVEERLDCDTLCSKKLFNEQLDKWEFGFTKKQQIDKTEKEALKDEEKGLYPCKFCHSWRTDWYQKQTRSADEPMTTFVMCKNCGKEHRH